MSFFPPILNTTYQKKLDRRAEQSADVIEINPIQKLQKELATLKIRVHRLEKKLTMADE